MENTPYQPIACADYDIYEIALMQNKCLKIKWKTEQGVIQIEQLKPEKLQIINKAEYLIINSNKIDKIRLDNILHVEIIKQ